MTQNKSINKPNPIRIEWLITRKLIFSKQRPWLMSKLFRINVLTTCISIAIPIFVLSILNGFNQMIQQKIISSQFHLRIHQTYGYLDKLRAIQKKLNAHPHIKFSIPFFEKQGLIRSIYQSEFSSVTIRAFENHDIPDNIPFLEQFQIVSKEEQPSKITQKWASLSNISRAPTKASQFAIKQKDHIIIGKALQESLGLYDGDGVNIFLPQGDLLFDLAPNAIKTLKLHKVYTAGFASFDTQLVFVSLSALKQFGLQPKATHLGIHLTNPQQIDEIVHWIGSKYPTLIIENSYDNPIFSDLAREKRIAFILLLFFMLCTFASLYLSVSIAISSKLKDIALFKVIGLKIHSIQRIFILHGLILSGLSILSGMLAGIVLIIYLDSFIRSIEFIGQQFLTFWNSYQFFSIQLASSFHIIDPNVFYITRFPYSIEIADLILLCSLSIATCTLAAYLPARNVSRYTVKVTLANPSN